ncbi:MAG: 3-dehydroquinate synthase, partial [Halieaceae bacterium]|nr:3-dehydroquinate synthase [Halieaceae bacterium]
REFAAGLAEVVKYGLIADAHFFHRLLESVDALKRRDQATISEVISRCCEIKADIVNQDEREGGVRAVLNFGHTFGHAIERELGFGQWLHGEAVAVGMVIATRISVARGQIDIQVLDGLVSFLESFDLPVAAPPEMSLDDFMRAMQGDKKVQSGRIRFVLLEGLGRACVTADVEKSEIAMSL